MVAGLVPFTDVCGLEMVPITHMFGREIGTNYRRVCSRDWYHLQTCVVAGLVPITHMFSREIGTNYRNAWSRDWYQFCDRTCLYLVLNLQDRAYHTLL